MAYSAAAEGLRRCTATTKRGRLCHAWATWSDASRRCIAHGGRAPAPAPDHRDPNRARVEPCTCRAYDWPHRPGSGLCRWPEPPTHRLATRAGTHQWGSRFRERLRMFRGTSLGGPVYLAPPSPLDDLLGGHPKPTPTG